MKGKRYAAWLVVVSVLTAACASTPSGKLHQVGSVLLALDDVVYQACLTSKQNGWNTLSEKDCTQARLAYSQASEAWKGALTLASADPKASITTYAVVVVTYILATVDTLKAAGIDIPPVALEYVEVIKESLRK